MTATVRRFIGLDPSMSCTGYAVLRADGSLDGAIEAGGTITPEGETLVQRAQSLLQQVRTLLNANPPDGLRVGVDDVLVVELPATGKREDGRKIKSRRGKGYKKQSQLAGPVYGFACCAVTIACIEAGAGPGMCPKIVYTNADEWGLKQRRGDGTEKGHRIKAGRVLAACGAWGLQKHELGSSDATRAEVADALLIARWGLQRSAAA